MNKDWYVKTKFGIPDKSNPLSVSALFLVGKKVRSAK